MSVRTDLEAQLAGLPGLERRRSRWGNSSAFYVGETEVLHFHGETRMDLRLTSDRIRELKAAGALDSRVQTRGPSAQWAAVRVRSADDLAYALELAEETVRANA